MQNHLPPLGFHRALLALACCCTVATAYEARHHSSTAAELIGYGDLLNDGRTLAMVIDRATGQYRLAEPAPGGQLTFSAPTPTGLATVDTFSIGNIRQPDALSIAVGGVLANRVHVIDPTAPEANPLALFTQTAGPRALAAASMNFPGHDATRMDLIVQSGWFDQPAGTVALFRSTAGDIDWSFEAPGAFYTDVQRVRRFENGQDYLMQMLRSESDGSVTATLVDPQNPSDLPLRTLENLPPGSRLIHGAFGPNATNQFLFFTPGATTLTIAAASNSNFIAPPVASNFDAPIESIHHARATNGFAKGFFVIFDHGAFGRFYHLNFANNLIEGATMVPPAGQSLTGLLSPAPGQMSLLSGPSHGGSSRLARHFSAEAGNWVATGETELAPATPIATAATAIFFQGEPFVNPNAVVSRAVRVPDWTSNAVLDPASSTIQRETRGDGSGLGNSEIVPLGPALPGESHLWANQLGGNLSVFINSRLRGPSGPGVEIDPPSGTYDRYFTPQITTSDPAATIFYQLGNSGVWSSATGGSVTIAPPGNALTPFTIQYYARYADGATSPVGHASYQWAGEPGSIDSDGDGVPDFVELALGLDPLAGDDSDGDGFSDLREILAGTDPTDGEDFPAAINPLEKFNTFNLRITPASFNSHTPNAVVPDRPSFAESADPTAPPATRIRVHGLDGRMLQSLNTRSHPTAPAHPGAQFIALPADDLDGFLVAGTTATFAIQPTPGITANPDPQLDDLGMENIRLIPVPALRLPSVPFPAPAVGEDPAQAAADWIAAATAHYDGLTRTSISSVLSFRDSLSLLLTERIIALLMAARDPSFDADAFTLTPFRDGGEIDVIATLRNLQSTGDGTQPAYLPQQIHSLVAQRVQTPNRLATTNIRALAAQIYRIAGTEGQANPGLYPSPFDTLREFLRGQPLPGSSNATSYANAITLNSTELASAQSAASGLLQQLTQRPVITFHTVVAEDSFASPIPVLRLESNAAPLSLFDGRGDPFRFPRGLALPPGTRLAITSFNDRTQAPYSPGSAVEVISVEITELPGSRPTDIIGNAIDDDWELAFFGTTGIDPFGDADGDGYTNLHEFLARTNPTSAASIPSGDPLPTEMPTPRISIRADGSLDLEFDFPTRYADQLGFRLQASTDLANFQEQPLSAQPDGLDRYHLHFTLPEAPPTSAFFRFRLTLGE